MKKDITFYQLYILALTINANIESYYAIRKTAYNNPLKGDNNKVYGPFLESFSELMEVYIGFLTYQIRNLFDMSKRYVSQTGLVNVSIHAWLRYIQNVQELSNKISCIVGHDVTPLDELKWLGGD